MTTPFKFILVDDDHFTNILSTIVLKRTLNVIDPKAFTEPELALDYLKEEIPSANNHFVLLLDINMPVIDGWEFMKVYENFDQQIKEKITIYILSSSVDLADKKRAEAHPDVKGFFSKPIEENMLLKIAAEEIEKRLMLA